MTFPRSILHIRAAASVLLASVLLMILCLPVLCRAAEQSPGMQDTLARPQRPNIVFILADDNDQFEYEHGLWA